MLTELAIKKLAAKDKAYMKADFDGLYIEVKPNGNKFFYSVKRHDGKRIKKSLGKWPDMSLVAAREANKGVWERVSTDIVFKDLLQDWFNKRIAIKAPSYQKSITFRLDKYILPTFADKRIEDVSAADVLFLCRKIQDDGFYETAHRVLNIMSSVFRYGIPLGVCSTDPTYGLSGALISPTVKHMATVTSPDEVTLLMNNLYNYKSGIIRNALLFTALTFGRPGEICGAEWSEISLERKEWRIPAEKMKMKRFHLVPLSDQAVEILKDEKELTAGRESKYVFPSERAGRKIPTDSLRVALRSIGYSTEELTTHGLRGMASTILNESGLWTADAIERQLAHVQGGVRAAYNHAEFLPERVKMMQWYSDFLWKSIDK